MGSVLGIFAMKIRDFTDFLIFSLIAGSRKKNYTGPISKFLDVLKSSRSESFISAIFGVQEQIMIRPDTGPLGDFSKNAIHSPTFHSTTLEHVTLLRQDVSLNRKSEYRAKAERKLGEAVRTYLQREM